MLYIQDRKNHTLAVLENYYDDLHSKILESGVSSYKFSIAKSQKGADFLIRGNYLVLDDDNGQGWKFTIITAEETHGVVEVESEDLGLELLNKVRNSWISPGSAKPFKYYFDKATRDTGWQIGINEISTLTRTLVWDGRDTALKRLLSIATQFDNAELEFKVEFKNLQVTKQIVNIYKKRGASRSDIQLVYGDSVNDIRKTADITELATALQGVGGVIQKDKTVEGEPEEHVTFSSLTYDDGEYFTPAGDPFLYARTANQQFNLSDNYLEDFYDYDTQSPQELLNRTLTQLKSRCEPKVNYEVDLAKVDASLNLGDTVTIVDHDYMPELLLNGRVLQLEKSYTDPSKNKVTLGNYLILYSTISDKLKKLQEQLKIIKPKTTYVWLRYAKDDQGNGMSAVPTADTKYFAMLVNKITAVPSDDPADYAEKWVLIKGEDGAEGLPGSPGADGKTPYLHIAYADSADGTDGFYVGGGRNYLVNSSNFSSVNNWSPNHNTTLSVQDGCLSVFKNTSSDFRGVFQTANLSPNDLGKNFTATTVVKNASDSTAKDMHIITHFLDSSFRMVDQKTVFRTDLSLSSDFQTFEFNGTIPNDSRIAILRIIFLTNNSATTYHVLHKSFKFELGDVATPWSPAPSEAHPIYMGTYTDYTQADSLDPTAYSWTQVKGDKGKDGVAGKDGLGIKSTAIAYQLSPSGTTTPTGTWSSTVPALVKGQYLWTRTDWTYTDGTAETGYSVSYIAKDGNNGTDGVAGKDGVGIKSTTITYQSGTSGTVQPTGTWVANPPSVTGGNYLWTRTIWSYTDNTSETGYSVAKAGEKGDKGDKGLQGDKGADGVAGKDGVGIKSTSVTYQASASGTTAPTGTWVASPTAIAGQYQWTRTVWTYTDGTTEVGYSVGHIGADGNDGADGVAGKDGVGITSTLIEYVGAVSGTIKPTSGWSTTIPVVPAGQYLWTRTTWQYTDGTSEQGFTNALMGRTGAAGKDGVDGKDGEPGSKDVPVTTVSAAQPTTAKNGDIWWVLNSTDVATAMKVYTSGAWVDKKVDQSVLNIVTLNAVTINGSTINGSEFNTSYTGTLENGQQGSSQQVLDKHGYSQTSTIPFFGEPIVTRSQIDNAGFFTTGWSNQSKYNPSKPWDNTEGEIYLDPINLYIGFEAKGLSGEYFLNVQDAYKNTGSATYLNGWGSWNADYSLKVFRQGQIVTVWGYIKHNNSATITPFAQVPAWARPQQGIVISAMTLNSSVGNPIASSLVMNADTGKIGFNSGGQKGGYVCFSTTYVGGDIVS